MKSLLLCLILFGQSAFASTGADALLQATGTTNQDSFEKTDSKVGDNNPFAKFKIDDAFLIHMFSLWKNTKGLSYESNQWLMSLFKHEFEKTGHLISAVQKHFPEEKTYDYIAAKLYSYYRLNLGQTFVSEYLKHAQDEMFRKTPAFKALHESTRKLNAFDWIYNTAPTIPADKTEFVLSRDPKEGLTIENALQAWALQKSGKDALKIIKYVPAGHPLMVPLSRTIVLSYSREGNVAEAGKILKRYLEPTIKKIKDPSTLTRHLLMIARMLYQVGVLDASEEYYEKIPNSSDDYLTARTELTWVLLRKGDVAKLRGQLTSLGLSLFEDKFNPEVYLVRSISNLKLCRYQEVAKDFKAFVKSNVKWAKILSAKLKESDPDTMGQSNYYLDLYKRQITLRQNEKATLDQLAQASIKAALPAVGVQPHWKNASLSMVTHMEQAKKTLATQSRLFWKNRKYVLKEAIRKMRFVKLETMTQLREAQMASNNAEGMESDVVSSRVSGLDKSENMVFRFDGVYWPDELFKLYSSATNHCLAMNGGK